MHYAASLELAFDAVERIMRDVSYNSLIRNAHANGASMLFIAGYIHMLRGLCVRWPPRNCAHVNAHAAVKILLFVDAAVSTEGATAT